MVTQVIPAPFARVQFSIEWNYAMLVFPAAFHVVYQAACARGPGGPVVVWYDALAGAIHSSSRGGCAEPHFERACWGCAGVECARFAERRRHSKAEANGKEDANDS
jgi:hypothetical protein